MGKIFNIGFNKAGTKSLSLACQVLGFNSVHYEVPDGDRLRDIIDENKRCRRPLLHGLEEYDFFSDFIGDRDYRELDEQYPDSKFILTFRDLESWLDSRERKVKANRKNPNYKYNFLTVDRLSWAYKYRNYLSELDKYFKFRPGVFLIINIPAGEGWEKLAPFLGKDIPAIDFPHETNWVRPQRRKRAEKQNKAASPG
jgi:hypothetical protein